MKHRIRAAAIIADNNKILLVKHVHPKTGHTWWVPPGGGIRERDNSIFDCIKREAFEETNLKINTSRIIYIREFLDKEDNELNIELFALADDYHGNISMENIHGNGPDELYIKDVKWLSKEETRGITVYPEILKDDFWDDYQQEFPNTKYLGRQV